ncbi:MAG: protein TolQ, partial [Gammaproteobacteria bacterium]|nr:protein TolQ [Gammaproteobacteria bacterium]
VKNLKSFETRFNSAGNLTDLYNEFAGKEDLEGMETIFVAGYRELIRLRQHSEAQAAEVMNGVERAMRLAISRIEESLENHLSFLATVGSTSPYIGLFGTVWGIMTAFQSLGHVEQATIAMVAPGISEALVATAMGLFAAIPAVIAYNRYANSVDRVLGRYEAFREEFLSLLFRQLNQRRED